MSFRKRNVALSSTRPTGDSASTSKERAQLPGVRPSPIDGRPTTSTGSTTLDGLFAGHAGLALGCSILIEESGTTDYAGALLRFYAAEGLVQGHYVHVFGLPEQWGRELPGVTKDSEALDKQNESAEKMKIAWRYERMGQFGSDASPRGVFHSGFGIDRELSERSSTDTVPQNEHPRLSLLLSLMCERQRLFSAIALT